MPLNSSLIGKEYPGVTYEVGREKIREFAAAVGETAAIFHDPEAAKQAGHPEQVAPPTFPTVLHLKSGPQVIADPELGLNYALVVHGTQEFEYRRPVYAGDILTATPRIADIQAKGPHEFLTIETTMTAAGGEVVCIARATLISRGTAASQ
ncbi:MAG TPA: MaoC family dehydratase N-terminal domain-containing protein [Actinomycetota bacterium]|nr:MaoC family dehydratase N-terminal domain-containing protein [Actinomycetota bacterium]